MPIQPVVLQRRLAEVGRIRIGEVKPTSNGKTRPSKLDTFRFTSASRELLEKVAAEYGGEVAAWTPANGGASQWELLTPTARVPVVIPPGAVTQWMEAWSGGGVQRRCDGEREVRTDTPCPCAAADQMICKPTTRLSVMLRDIEGLGVWRLESHGWNAAAELPGTADFLAQHGGYIPAFLYLKAVRQVTDGQTRDFMVPALAVEGWTPGQAIAGAPPAGQSQLEGGQTAALESAADWPGLIAGATTRAELLDIRRRAKEAGMAPAAAAELDAAMKARAEQIGETGSTAPQPVRSADVVWNEILFAVPEGTSVPEIERDVESRTGVALAQATAEHLEEYLAFVQRAVSGEVVGS